MTPVLYLFADETVVVRSQTSARASVRLHGVLKLDMSPPTGDIELTVFGPTDNELHISENITPHPAPRTQETCIWSHSVTLPQLGRHRASWTLGGTRSNTIDLDVLETPSPSRSAPLTAEPIPSLGIRGEPDLLVRLTNLTGAVIDRGLAFLRCAAIVDGQRHHLRAPTWDGMPELAPGQSTWFLFALDDFEPRPAAGTHQIQIDMAGRLSPPIEHTILPR